MSTIIKLEDVSLDVYYYYYYYYYHYYLFCLATNITNNLFPSVHLQLTASCNASVVVSGAVLRIGVFFCLPVFCVCCVCYFRHSEAVSACKV